jgi:DNA mismatch endonuclease (patch repair protein)
MADHLTREKRSWNMSRIRSKNTTPELYVRRALTSQGLRYRLHANNLPGKPDIVMTKIKTAIFVNGCFWHQHPNCSRSTSPRTNKAYWQPKLQKNIERQDRAFRELKKDNWNIVTVWECETKDQNLLNGKLRKEIQV